VSHSPTNESSAPAVSSGPQPATENPLRSLLELGQSLWLDDLRRSLLTSGEFNRLIAEDRLRGVTSNPSIFERAFAGDADYRTFLRDMKGTDQMDGARAYELLAIRDVRDAADLLRPVYDLTDRADGYASLEVSPYVAYDSQATIAEARRLWHAIGRDNVMIKVPASKAGLPAVRQLTSEGINVNITLLFGVDRYEEVARAYMDGLSIFIANGGDATRVSSVASFFVSRIDTLVDDMVTRRVEQANDGSDRALLTGLLGRVAIANARLAYQRYLTLCRTPAWQTLAAKGAHPQRLLWASTSTKNVRYRDVRYVEELIGRDTVTTVTPKTIAAFRDHGRPRASLEEDLDDAHRVVETLDRVGISLPDGTEKLLTDGVTLFCTAFDNVLAAAQGMIDSAREKTHSNQ
jgi:transaldolase / glucose-6-phosphate isomerase